MNMDNKEFVNNNGEKCPYCGSDFIVVAAEAIVVGKLMTRHASCNACKNHWKEDYEIKYTLKGYRAFDNSK